MATKMDLIRKLRSSEHRRVLEAVAELRVRGWLCDGALVNVALCHVHMQGADLAEADLRNVDFHQAHLQWADLSRANLSGAKLNRVNLEGANMSQTNLAGAELFKANLQGVLNLTEEQLAEAKRLRMAILPDNRPYDGRFNLPGDVEVAERSHFDVQVPTSMAEYYGVPLETYLYGQEVGKLLRIGEVG